MFLFCEQITYCQKALSLHSIKCIVAVIKKRSVVVVGILDWQSKYLDRFRLRPTNSSCFIFYMDFLSKLLQLVYNSLLCCDRKKSPRAYENEGRTGEVIRILDWQCKDLGSITGCAEQIHYASAFPDYLTLKWVTWTYRPFSTSIIFVLLSENI